VEVRDRYVEDTSPFHVRLRKGHLEEAPAAAVPDRMDQLLLWRADGAVSIAR